MVATTTNATPCVVIARPRVLEIPDADGRTHDYLIARALPDALKGERWACSVDRLDGEGDSPYHVALTHAGSWTCDCSDSFYRARKLRRACKHAAHVAPLYLTCEEIMPKAAPAKTRKPDEQPPQQAPAGAADTSLPHGQAPAAVPAPAEPPAAVGVDLDAVAQALAAPFDAAEVKFKPKSVSGNRALAIPYVDARVVMDRLDDVLGVLNWQDSYHVLADGNVVCTLRVRIGGEWVTKTDVGGQSEQPDEGDRTKAAFSDALKRAAVKFGVGRFLYRQKAVWCDYDPQKKQFVSLPVIAGLNAPKQQQQSAAKKPAAAAEQSAPPKADFHASLVAYDKELAGKKLFAVGDLVKYVAARGKEAGYAADMSEWNEHAVAASREWTRLFIQRCREGSAA